MIGSWEVLLIDTRDVDAAVEQLNNWHPGLSPCTLQLPITCIISDYSVGDHGLMAD